MSKVWKISVWWLRISSSRLTRVEGKIIRCSPRRLNIRAELPRFYLISWKSQFVKQLISEKIVRSTNDFRKYVWVGSDQGKRLLRTNFQQSTMLTRTLSSPNPFKFIKISNQANPWVCSLSNASCKDLICRFVHACNKRGVPLDNIVLTKFGTDRRTDFTNSIEVVRKNCEIKISHFNWWWFMDD